MATAVASRSGQLARPGAPLDDLDAADAFTVNPDGRDGPTAVADDYPDQADTTAREIRWACEWWPPT